MQDIQEDDTAKAQARNILGPSKENEFLQSFVRVGMGDDAEQEPSVRPGHKLRQLTAQDRPGYSEEPQGGSSSAEPKREPSKRKERRGRSRRRVRREEEVYTDKDRAAAVVMGSRDIKQSLSMKSKQERTNALHLPEETDAGTLLALGRCEMRAARTQTAIQFVDKALELSPEDKHALVSRSKCHLLLGHPKAALADAEAALAVDKNFVRAIYQKAEALFYSGEFEHSLMFYHRGMRLRPDLEGFRLGIQKAQEAIENTIGASTPAEHPTKPKPAKSSVQKFTVPTKTHRAKCSHPLLGQLMVDKLYLENLLKHPDLNVADKKTNSIAAQAEEAITFLNNRAEFWRQQQTSGTH